jgi:hypothetical protein
VARAGAICATHIRLTSIITIHMAERWHLNMRLHILMPAPRFEYALEGFTLN